MRELRLPFLLISTLSVLAAAGCANRPPVLNCLVEQETVTEGEQTTIRTNATDPNRDPLTFEWNTTGGKVNSQNGSAIFDSSGLSAGRYTITANVSDQKNPAVTCSVSVAVGKNQQPPTVSCDPSNVRVTEGQSTTLRPRASDPNNDPLTYAWQVDGQDARTNQATFEFGTTGRQVGSHTTRVTVTDVDGMSANCSYNVTVERRPNRNPTVTLTLDKNEVFAGDTVVAKAAGRDPDGDPLTYAWSIDGQSRPERAAEFRINTSGLAGGSHTVSVTARDDRDGSGTDTASFTVTEKITIQINQIQPDNIAKAQLDEIALKMQQNPRLRAVLTGHTDDRGSEEANQRVGQRRAEAAKDYLVTQHQVDAGRIEARSEGEGAPASSNDTEEGRRANRRVEVELSVQ